MSIPYLLGADKADVIISLTASPTRLGSDSDGSGPRQVNYEHHRTYARLLSTYSVFVNRVGIEDGVAFWGGSAIFTPSGRMLAEAQENTEQLLTATLDDAEVRRARRSSRHALDERPDILLQNLERIRRR
jgi:predicted amidohydrolase